jgi:hypothetical protein
MSKLKYRMTNLTSKILGKSAAYTEYVSIFPKILGMRLGKYGRFNLVAERLQFN